MFDRMDFGDGLGSGLGGILQYLFTDPSKAYRKAGDIYERFLKEGRGALDPYQKAGSEALPRYTEELEKMRDPSKFLEDILGGYEESPLARLSRQSAMRGATNLGSATGLIGSTPLSQFQQQQTHDIGMQDVGDYLKNILGIKGGYLQGTSGLVGRGQEATNALLNLLGQFGGAEAEAAYGGEAAKQARRGGLFGSLGSLLGSIFG